MSVQMRSSEFTPADAGAMEEWFADRSGDGENDVTVPAHMVPSLRRALRSADAALGLLEALKEIAKAEGPFKRDRLAHAEATIDHMVGIAERAIARTESTDMGGAES